jgi:hypothetical protein
MGAPGASGGPVQSGWLGRRRKPAPGAVRPHESGYWNGDSMAGAPSIRISLGEQRVYYYKGGKLAGVSPISSGREGATKPGTFRIIEKQRHHKSSLYGEYLGADGDILQTEVDSRTDPLPVGARFDGANMPYFMRITGAVGMHEGGVFQCHADRHTGRDCALT